MARLYLLCGPSGSGKTTFVNSRDDYYAGWISRDIIRFQLLGEDEDYFAHEKLVFNIFVDKLQTMLDTIGVAVADATHLNWASRRKLLNRLNLDGVEVIAVNFKVPLKVCLERNRLRTGRACVPDKVIVQQFKHFNPASFREYDYAAIYNVDTNGKICPEQRCGHCIYEVGCTLNIYGGVCKNFKRDPPDGGYYG